MTIVVVWRRGMHGESKRDDDYSLMID